MNQANPYPSDAQSDSVRIASCIQSTVISNRFTTAMWEQHIADCVKYQFNAAMIPPAWVARTARALRSSRIKTASFIDYPYGTMTSAGKAHEAGRLVDAGAQEIDLMPNVGFLLSGMEQEYADDIAGVVTAARGVPIKIMLELPLLNQKQRERAVALSLEARVAYLKNASGGAVGVATPEEIAFLRRLAPPEIKIKASGGIKTAEQVRQLLAAGADLVGTSAGVAIMNEFRRNASPSQETTAGNY